VCVLSTAIDDSMPLVCHVFQELEMFNKDLLQKPAVLALNKIDTDQQGKLTDHVVDLVKALPGKHLNLSF
jgi:GTPase involved in cell partitioning and DNA repair